MPIGAFLLVVSSSSLGYAQPLHQALVGASMTLGRRQGLGGALDVSYQIVPGVGGRATNPFAGTFARMGTSKSGGPELDVGLRAGVGSWFQPGGTPSNTPYLRFAAFELESGHGWALGTATSGLRLGAAIHGVGVVLGASVPVDPDLGGSRLELGARYPLVDNWPRVGCSEELDNGCK